MRVTHPFARLSKARRDRWRARISYAWAIRRRIGPGRWLAMILRSLLEPLVSWRTYDFYARDLVARTAPVTPYQATIPLAIRIATEADFLRFRPTLQGVRRWEAIEAMRRAGDLCFIGVSGENLAHFTWLCRRSVWLAWVGAALRVGPDEAYIASSYTEPAFRGQGVQPAVTNFMIRWEQAAGIRHHYYSVVRHNVPGRKITKGHHAGSAPDRVRTVRTIQLAFARSFLVYGLEPTGIPHLEPAQALDLGPVGLWVRPVTPVP